MSRTRHSDNGALALEAGAVYVKDGLTKPVYLMGEAELERFIAMIESKQHRKSGISKLNQMFLEQAA